MRFLRRRVVFAVVGAVVLAACARPADPVAADLESARDRTVPPGGRVLVSYPLSRDRGTASASWQVETEMEWNAYAVWVDARLREYRVAERESDRLRFTRQLEGDLYVIVLVGKPASNSVTIEASFEARPF